MTEDSTSENLVEQAFRYVENCFHSIMNTVRDFWLYNFNRQND